jgi:hypothetical protein
MFGVLKAIIDTATQQEPEPFSYARSGISKICRHTKSNLRSDQKAAALIARNISSGF